MSLLETINVENLDNEFVMPVQNVIRPNLDYRAFCGRVSSGIIEKGEKLDLFLLARVAKIESINIGNKLVNKALAISQFQLLLMLR